MEDDDWADEDCLKYYLQRRFSGEYAWLGEGRKGIREHFTMTHVASWLSPENMVGFARKFYKLIDFKDNELPSINVSRIDSSQEPIFEIQVK